MGVCIVYSFKCIVCTIVIPRRSIIPGESNPLAFTFISMVVTRVLEAFFSFSEKKHVML